MGRRTLPPSVDGPVHGARRARNRDGGYRAAVVEHSTGANSAEPDRSGRTSAVTPTVFAAVLAACAGAVDAICFDRVFGVFPANQSGNAVLLGIGIGSERGIDVWRPALAIAGFALGVAVAILLGSRLPRRRRPDVLLAIEIALLVPLAIVLTTTEHPRTELDDPATFVLLLLTCAAMGIQTEVIGRAAGVVVATTYQSGAIVRIAELTTGTDRAGRPPSLAARSVAVLTVVLGAYVGGAALGAALGSWSASLFVPIGMLVVVGVVLVTTPSADPPPGA